MNKPMENNIITVDCHYVRDQLTASYIVKGSRESVIIETGHPGAVKHILNALKENEISPLSISAIFITHVHLDHCGGLSGLMKTCTNAKVYCHPRAQLHLTDPEKLIQGSKVVYGEPLFNSLYSGIEPIPNEKIVTVEDGEIIKVANNNFVFFHTAGHAKHHVCIHETTSDALFTGDTFGLAYPDLQRGSRKFIYPATTPTDFDIAEARKSILRIRDLKVKSIYLTHFGIWDDVNEGAVQLLFALDEIEQMQVSAQEKKLEGEALQNHCREGLKNFILHELEKRNLSLTTEQWKVFDYDVKLNSMGIAFAIDKARRNINR